MRILFVTPSIPSSLHRVRALNLLTVLSAAHDVHLVTLAPAHDLVHATEHLSFLPFPPRVVPHPFHASLIACAGALLRGASLEIAYCASRAMTRAVADACRTFRPDLIFLKRLRSAQFLPERPPCPVILDATDAMAESYRRALPFSPPLLRPVFWYEAHAYARLERLLAQTSPLWVIASPADAARLTRSLRGAVRCVVVPNVVDTEIFSPLPDPPPPPRLVFSGLLDKVVNTSAALFFVRQVFPSIRRVIPQVELTIAGPRPTRDVRRLGAEPGVRVTGLVADLRPLLAEAHAVVVPVRAGTGTRNKILQAWASRRAVVSTPEGAEGLDTRHGENCLLASTPDAFAAAVIRVLTDRAFRQSLGAAGRATVDASYDLRALARGLDDVLALARHDHATIRGPWARVRTPAHVASSRTAAPSSSP